MGCLASLSQSLRYRHFPTPQSSWDGQKITAHFNLPNQWPWLTNEVSSWRYTSYTVDLALLKYYQHEGLPDWEPISSLHIALITTWNKSELPPSAFEAFSPICPEITWRWGQRRGSVAAFASHGFAATKIDLSQSMRGVGYVRVWDSYQILSAYKKISYVSGVRFICYCHDQRRPGKCCCSIEHFAKVLDRWIATKYNFIEFNLYKQIYLKGSVAATAHIDHWCWVVQRSVILPPNQKENSQDTTDGQMDMEVVSALCFCWKVSLSTRILVWCNLSFDVSFILLACRIICEGMMAKVTIVYTHTHCGKNHFEVYRSYPSRYFFLTALFVPF